MFSKLIFFIFFFFLTMMLLIYNHLFFFSLSSLFSFSIEEKILPFFFNLSLDSLSLVFVSMVCLVTTLVFLYSEFYMESYNNKKFFYITLSFFFSMTVLASSGGLMNAMIGWDGLGISSLFLIMFYPNKVSFFNSFMTFFFNRLGDILFLIFFCFFISSYSVFFYLSEFDKFWVIFIFFLCLLTKSAQFPFSSWLPAAMSAPTPISAMVHSSTLVTAGIYIFFKFCFIFLSFGILKMLLGVSVMTFVLGGLLGMIEWDLKKIVAFSTMSQISMILFFISTGGYSIALCHTFFHALFKTLLFCGCGIVFMWSYSDQLIKNFSSKSISLPSAMFIFFSIYSMSGLIFSSSFYTKDLMMELFLEDKFGSVFLTLLLGSVFTIIYSSKIFLPMTTTFNLKNFFGYKISHFFFFLLFTFLTVVTSKLVLEFSFSKFFCSVGNVEVLILNLLFFSLFFLQVSIHSFVSLEVYFMKNIFFSYLSKVNFLTPLSFTMSDNFFFSPMLVDFNTLKLKDFYKTKFWIYPMIILSLYFCYYCIP